MGVSNEKMCKKSEQNFDNFAFKKSEQKSIRGGLTGRASPYRRAQRLSLGNPRFYKSYCS
jgi:hypothetical protein